MTTTDEPVLWTAWGLKQLKPSLEILSKEERNQVEAAIRAVLSDPETPDGFPEQAIRQLEPPQRRRLRVTPTIVIVYDICPEMPPVARKIVVFRQVASIRGVDS